MIGDHLRTFAALAVVLTGATGCAGARTNVVADDARYPISLSRAVRDEDGRLVESGRAVKVGALRHEKTAWGLLYSAISLTPRTDISATVNQRVEAAGGDAVVNLRVSGSECATDWFAILTFLPVWPGCTNVVVEGDVVRVTRRVGSHGRTAGTRVRLAEALR